MRALIVDDSRAMRSIVSRIVKQLGYEITEATDGKDALGRLAEAKPDLILVDWNMPEMNGLEFVRAVRSDPGHAAMRIVMVTTESEIVRVQEALESGADEYLMKPFTKEALIEKLILLGLASPEAAE